MGTWCAGYELNYLHTHEYMNTIELRCMAVGLFLEMAVSPQLFSHMPSPSLFVRRIIKKPPVKIRKDCSIREKNWFLWGR